MHLQPGNFFSCLVGKLVDGGGPRVGWVSVDSIDVCQVVSKDAGTVEHLLNGVVGAAIGGHEAAELLGEERIWRTAALASQRRDSWFPILSGEHLDQL